MQCAHNTLLGNNDAASGALELGSFHVSSSSSYYRPTRLLQRRVRGRGTHDTALGQSL